MITKIFGRDALRGWIIASAAMVAVSSSPGALTASNRGQEAAQMHAKMGFNRVAVSYTLGLQNNTEVDHNY